TSAPRMASPAPCKSAVVGEKLTDSFSPSCALSVPRAPSDCANVASSTLRGSAEPIRKRPRRPSIAAVEITSRFFSMVKARLTSPPRGSLRHGRLTHDAHSASAQIAVRELLKYIPPSPRRTLHKGDRECRHCLSSR